jgi:hypothetical protein
LTPSAVHMSKWSVWRSRRMPSDDSFNADVGAPLRPALHTGQLKSRADRKTRSLP